MRIPITQFFFGLQGNVGAHPKTYSGDEVNAELFASLSRAQGDLGFGMQCSGIEDLCHFTARKFSPPSRYALLENIDLILSDDDVPYSGNPWAHYQSRMRKRFLCMH